MTRYFACAALALTLFSVSAKAADCGADIDALSKAVSGNLNMTGDKKAALLRMAMTGYDHCMVGDTKHSGEIRDMIMAQIKESLGGR